MKKYIYFLLMPMLIGFGSAKAQSFTMQHDTLKGIMQKYLVEYHNDVKNETTDTISVTWKVISHNVPTDWADNGEFGICDNAQCYLKTILDGSTRKTLPIDGSTTMPFKVQLSGKTGITSTGTYYVTIELLHNTTMDTVVFELSNWATSVSTVSSGSDKISMYPNPARSELNVTYDKDAGVKSISVYNLVGKQVAKYKVGGSSAKLDIENIPSGVYFIRLMDNTGRVMATRRFTHQ